jgi:hypothetical protein
MARIWKSNQSENIVQGQWPSWSIITPNKGISQEIGQLWRNFSQLQPFRSTYSRVLASCHFVNRYPVGRAWRWLPISPMCRWPKLSVHLANIWCRSGMDDAIHPQSPRILQLVLSSLSAKSVFSKIKTQALPRTPADIRVQAVIAQSLDRKQNLPTILDKQHTRIFSTVQWSDWRDPEQ